MEWVCHFENPWSTRWFYISLVPCVDDFGRYASYQGEGSTGSSRNEDTFADLVEPWKMVAMSNGGLHQGGCSTSILNGESLRESYS
jgi:hypothetical protein